ncbi:MAG: hypothetical protein Tsb002_27250 [Wenzhouxiangellaceae bacterium]
MKNTLISLLSASSLVLAGAANAGHDDDRGGRGYDPDYQYAKVINVTPQYETVRVPYEREVCYNQRIIHHEPRRGNTAPVLLGAVLGGLVGNKIDGGRRRGAGTAIGAVVGGAIANGATRHRRHGGYSYPVDRQQCEIRTEYRYEEQMTGYDVAYRYRGEVYHTHMVNHPGERIKVQVAVTPVEY